MSTSRQALLVIGSGRGRQSNSHALGSYLLQQLAEAGWGSETDLLLPALRADEGEALAAKALQADLLILACPLYVDSLPAAVTRFLERLAQGRTELEAKPPRLAAIVNCGFPGVHHNRLALRICEQFCREVGWPWAGGLAMGAGEVLGGQDLRELGWVARHQRAALDRAATDLTTSGVLSAEAVTEMARPAIPVWYYLYKANQGFHHEAARHGVEDALALQPYADEPVAGEHA